MTDCYFVYPNPDVESVCEWHAQEIEKLTRTEVASAVAKGRHLIAVKAALNNSRPVFLQWLDWRLGCCEETANNYMRLARFIDDNPNVLEKLRSASLGYRIARLPNELQAQIVAQGAFTEPEVERIVAEAKRREWTEAMEQHLIDGHPDLATRYGDVLYYIEEAKDDPVLAPAAAELYEKHREEFARLAERPVVELDAEMGPRIELREPDRPRPLLAAGEKFAIFRFDGGRWVFHSPVPEWLEVNGTLLLCRPDSLDGPVSRALQSAAWQAACREIRVRSLEELAEEAE